MAELADAHGSGPCGATCAGSNPVIRIIIKQLQQLLSWKLLFFKTIAAPKPYKQQFRLQWKAASVFSTGER